MTLRSLPLLAALAFTPMLVPLAHAGEVEKAEHIRISEEMRKLAARNAWSAVEASYKRLEELEHKGEVISYKEFMLGAEAARALGDMTSSRLRVKRAADLDPTKEALDTLADIDANYGRVEIAFDAKYNGARALVPAVPPFAPDQRASITFVSAQLEAGKGYAGLLPAGDYSVGTDKVTVKAGDHTASLKVGAPVAVAKNPPPTKEPKPPKETPTKPPAEPFKLAFVGLRGEVGVAYTLGGDVAQTDTLQAGAFSGMGARLGVGLEVGLSKNFGVIAQVGYHNLFGQAEGSDDPTYTTATNNLHLGYGWLAADLRLGKVWIAAGPVWSIGTAAITGVATGCQTSGCEAGHELGEDVMAHQRFTGDLRMGGGAGSLSFGLVDLGSLTGALTVEGGAQSDTTRLYPWGQVAFTIAPSAERRK